MYEVKLKIKRGVIIVIIDLLAIIGFGFDHILHFTFLIMEKIIVPIDLYIIALRNQLEEESSF